LQKLETGREDKGQGGAARERRTAFTECTTHKQTTVFWKHRDKEGCSVATKNKPDAWMIAQEEFTAEQWAAVESVIKKYKAKPGSLIPVLEEVQEAVGYLPKPIMERVALGLTVPFSEVYGVVTFYSFFTMAPKGRHTIRCCLGTACYVRGGKKIMETLTETLNVQPGETTPDRSFSLETVRCLGACGLAPVVVVDEDTHRQMKPSKISGVLEAYDK
jgi:NADH-quinone oxidoreductase E subunit